MFTKQISVVWRKRFGTIEEQTNARLRKQRHAMCCIFHKRCNVFEVFRQRGKRKLFRDALHAPWLCNWFKPAHQQLACVFFEISATVLVAQHRHRWRDSLNGLGDNVKVLGCMQRNCCANCVAQLARPHSSAVHNCIGPNHFAVGNYANCSAAFNNNSFNFYVLKNFDTVRACTLCKRLRHVDWVNDTVSWQVHCTDQVVHSSKWH